MKYFSKLALILSFFLISTHGVTSNSNLNYVLLEDSDSGEDNKYMSFQSCLSQHQEQFEHAWQELVKESAIKNGKKYIKSLGYRNLIKYLQKVDGSTGGAKYHIKDKWMSKPAHESIIIEVSQNYNEKLASKIEGIRGIKELREKNIKEYFLQHYINGIENICGH